MGFGFPTAATELPLIKILESGGLVSLFACRMFLDQPTLFAVRPPFLFLSFCHFNYLFSGVNDC